MVAFFCFLRRVISSTRSIMGRILVFCVAKDKPTSGNLTTALRRAFRVVHVYCTGDQAPETAVSPFIIAASRRRARTIPHERPTRRPGARPQLPQPPLV